MNLDMLREQLKKLIEDFRNNEDSYKKQLEANTETKLVEPLFELLGWTKKDFVKQEIAHRGEKKGHADYAFFIDGKIVFFLEVKKVGIDLDKEADKQVISYALSRRVPFAVSTNFEELKIFCVEQENAQKNVFRVFREPENYIDNMSDLLFLSKENFERGLTLKKAEDEGRLKKRISIDKTLLEDLMHIRSLIASDIERNYPSKYELNEKEEIIQRIIDRLIFIRRCEDVNINPDNLTLEQIGLLPDDEAYPKLKQIFKRYNEVYNSGLFAIGIDNDCDKITIHGKIIKELVHYLYKSKDEKYIYNFDWIDADVLGQVYEQYLGKILQQTKSGKAKLQEGQAHRKEQGIYYTPTYIVDYIVKNTVGELLKDKKTDPKKIKILDPACGSGSFLIKAFDYLYSHFNCNGEDIQQKRLDSQGTYSLKTEILKNNIYGVDLDQKAVEITKLNLLLKAAEKGRKLPEEVDLHIKHGNSLIDDEKIAGLNAFKWEKDFQEGTFDVVIGNPPWGADIDDILEYLEKNYPNSTNQHKDIYKCFIEKGMKLLKENGILGLIVPNTCLLQPRYKDIRLFLKKYTIQNIINLGEKVFENVEAPSCILVIKKKQSVTNNIMNILDLASSKDNNYKLRILANQKYLELKQSVYDKTIDNNFVTFYRENKPDETLFSQIVDCRDAGINYQRIGVGMKEKGKSDLSERLLYENNSQLSKKDKEYLKGEDIVRYFIKSKTGRFVRTNYKEFIKKNEVVRLDEKTYSKVPKILWRQTADRPIATIDNVGVWFGRSIQAGIVINEKFSIKYLLALLNSKFFAYLYIQSVRESGRVFPQVKLNKIQQLPVKIITLEKQKSFEVLVDKLFFLNKKLNEISEKQTSEKAKLEEEIKKTDQEIDELVYKIYGITEKERKIIEESLK